jgi:hypothetical protein
MVDELGTNWRFQVGSAMVAAYFLISVFVPAIRVRLWHGRTTYVRRGGPAAQKPRGQLTKLPAVSCFGLAMASMAIVLTDWISGKYSRWLFKGGLFLSAGALVANEIWRHRPNLRDPERMRRLRLTRRERREAKQRAQGFRK